ncbi:lipopolysaccharide biosynthesis protein [Cupriavidus basilensis]|uniref:lipopolysaccharide biosynthesis protein n=1 Tax=Cupriavidus basilensis TaxID=68895 RepID=UPI0039F70522
MLVQLASVPAFLSVWSLEEYGQWLILTALPTYFALSDIGFLAVTINKMTMVAAANDKQRVNVLFQTANKLCLLAISIAVFLATLVVVFSKVAPLDILSNKIVLVVLVISAALSMSGGLFDAVFRSSGEFAVGAQLMNGARLMEWLGMLAGLLLGRTFLSAAVGQLSGRLIASVIAWKVATYRHPNVRWGISMASGNEFRQLIKPAISFMAFPVANAISIQGMTILVGHVFGATFLAVFSTYRTISRVLVQAVTIIGRSMWPEISVRFGEGDIKAVMSLYRRGTYASVLVALGLFAFMHFCGEIILRNWTAGRIPFESGLFYLFLVATTITSFWQMGMVLLAATNNHVTLSRSYLVCAIASVLLAFLLKRIAGEYAPLIGLIAFEVAIVVMCAIHVKAFKVDVLGTA